MGLATLLGARDRGIFIPYRHADALPEPAPGHPALEPVFAAADEDFRAVLDRIDTHAGALAALDGPAPEPRWTQTWFPRADGAAAYVLARDDPPRRIVEVGSGHSTRFLARALKDAGAEAEHVCIDPAPRAPIRALPLRTVEALLGPEHLALFDALGPGDMAVFDSSHILHPGTDVDLILTGVLPRLAPGVRVHVHDVFLPDPYPADWTWRGYSEQLGVACWLLAGGLRPIWSSAWAISRLDAARRPGLAALPWAGAPESSLWAVRTAPAPESP